MAERSKYEMTLTPEQVVDLAGPMASLTAHEAWPEFMELLRGLKIQAREAAFEDSPDAMPFWKGYVQALGDLAGLPLLAVAAAKETAQREEITSRRKARRREDEGDI